MGEKASNNSKLKDSLCFNKQVNTILFIMFLTVVLMLCIMGCLFSFPSNAKNERTQTSVKESVSCFPGDSIIVQ